MSCNVRVLVPRGFRKKRKSKHNSDEEKRMRLLRRQGSENEGMNDALKIDRTNTDRLDRILRHLDDPDPTGALFGIKTDQSWTDFVDEDMERYVEDALTAYSPASALGPPPPPISPADIKPLDQKPTYIGKGSKGKKATKAAAATAAAVTSSAAGVAAAAAGNGGVGNRGGGGGAGGRGKGRTKPEDTLAPEVRAAKDEERRISNNTRERMRVRGINEALNELGRIVSNLNPPKNKEEANVKPCTKLAILNSAVDIITSLEKKVRENLNPNALCAPGGSGFASAASLASSPPPNMNVGANGSIMPSSFS